MSTTKRAKAARQAAHAKAKKDRELKKLFTPKKRKNEFRELKVDYTYEDPTKSIPSISTTPVPHATAKRESQKYTGSFIKGIGTMHKSNAIPVVDSEFMKELSKMRRG